MSITQPNAPNTITGVEYIIIAGTLSMGIIYASSNEDVPGSHDTTKNDKK